MIPKSEIKTIDGSYRKIDLGSMSGKKIWRRGEGIFKYGMRHKSVMIRGIQEQAEPFRMAIINKSTKNKCSQGCGERETLFHCWWECRLVQPLWKAVWRYFKKLKMDLPFDPMTPLLGIYSKEPKTLVQKSISTPMFIAALISIAKIWKQPKCPSVYEWIKQLWDIHTMDSTQL